jgi:hypothetical protein
MTRLWAGGAKLQSAANAVEFSAIINAAPAIETTTRRSGAAAWRIANAGAIEGFRVIHTAAQGSFFFRFYLYIVAMPTGTRYIGGARQTANRSLFAWRRRASSVSTTPKTARRSARTVRRCPPPRGIGSR